MLVNGRSKISVTTSGKSCSICSFYERTSTTCTSKDFWKISFVASYHLFTCLKCSCIGNYLFIFGLEILVTLFMKSFSGKHDSSSFKFK